EVWVKHENLLPTGAFKVRGGIKLMAQLDAGVRARGVVTASSGNHGQSVAYAARLFGTTAIICAPENANPVKVECMRDLGAEAINPAIQVIGVQSAQSPAAHDAWRAGQLLERPNATVAEGLATRTTFDLPQRIMRRLLDDFVLVDDRDLLRAVRLMVEKTRTLVEPAGAAPLA